MNDCPNGYTNGLTQGKGAGVIVALGSVWLCRQGMVGARGVR